MTTTSLPSIEMENQQALPSGDAILERFDELVESGLVHLDTSQSVTHSDEGATFEFRVASLLHKKPGSDQVVPNSSSYEPGSDIDYVPYQIAIVLGTHVLAANKFSFARPSLLLLTKDGFRRQWESLDGHDLTALSTVLGVMSSSPSSSSPRLLSSSVAVRHEETPGRGSSSEDDDALCRRPANDWIGFYNCGVRGGCSRLHKHLQAIPYPDGVTLWPDTDFEPPFHVFRRDIGYLASPDELIQAYRALLAEATTEWKRRRFEPQVGDESQGREGSEFLERSHCIPHNVLLTRRWLMVIPRTRSRINGAFANALSMAGLVPVTTSQELEQWILQGPMDLLIQFGVAK